MKPRLPMNARHERLNILPPSPVRPTAGWGRWSIAVMVLVAGMAVCSAPADGVRNVKEGSPMPEFTLVTSDNGRLDQASLRGSVAVLVCVSPGQEASQRALVEASAVLAAHAKEPMRLVYMTAEGEKAGSIHAFCKSRKLEAPFAVDTGRAFTDSVGLIVFPTTIVVNKDGTLAHVLTMCTDDYRHTLDAYVRHALGSINHSTLPGTLLNRSIQISKTSGWIF